MADFAPPSGPPPPHVPEGWKAVWNDQYKEWFYVNLYTKKSQWDKPTEPIYSPPADAPPPGAPPGYDHTQVQHVGPEKGGLGTNTTGEQLFAGGAGSSHVDTSGDEAFARKLQEEENARLARESGPGNRGASDGYYNQGQGGPAPYGQQGAYGQGPAPYNPNQIPPTSPGGTKSKGGFLGKLLGKAKMGGASSHPPMHGGPGSAFPPQQGYGHPPQGGYYGGSGGYPQQIRPQRQGMGAGGAAALGAGGGLVGGMLLANAMDGGDGGGHYGGDDGGNYGGDDGGNYGGDDGGGYGGGDGGFGGDDGGGGDYGGDGGGDGGGGGD